MTYEENRKALIDEAQALIDAGKLDEASAKNAEIEKLQNDHEAALKAQANLDALKKEPAPANFANFAKIPAGIPAETVQMTNGNVPEPAAPVDMRASKEYRTAFMNYITRGAAIPAEFRNENAQSTTGEVGAVIPTTIINRIIEKLEVTGRIWSRITKTSYKGGVAVPVSSVKPVASWVAERGTSDTQEKTVTSVTFAYRKLICKVAISFEVSVVTLDIFEAKIAENIAEAMIKKLEQAFISGTGATYNQPVGILTETPVSGQTIEIAESASVTYKDLAKAEGALPLAYDDGAVWNMTKSTFMNCFVGMVDNDGRPVIQSIIGTNGKPVYYLLGREVVLLDNSYLPSYTDSVDADTIFAFMFNWKDYIANTNFEITLREYIDEATDDRVKKALMLVDGKAVDINSLVVMIKKNT